MEKVLLYNITGKKAIEIKLICRKLNISSRDVDKSEYLYTIEALLNESTKTTVSTETDSFKNEMLFIAGLSSAKLDRFVTLLNKKKVNVELKAVLTDTNKDFTSLELFRELSQEHESMKQGNTLHTQA